MFPRICQFILPAITSDAKLCQYRQQVEHWFEIQAGHQLAAIMDLEN
jgi:hypothetical protein